MPEKICMPFCCRGRVCKTKSEEACTFLHPRSSIDLKIKTIKMIGDHFLAEKISWFNEYHFMRLV